MKGLEEEACDFFRDEKKKKKSSIVVTLIKRDRRTRKNNEQARSKENRNFFFMQKDGKDFVEKQIKIKPSAPSARSVPRFRRRRVTAPGWFDRTNVTTEK